MSYADELTALAASIAAERTAQFKVAIVPGHLRHIELYCTRMGCQWSSDIDIEQPHLSTLIEVAEMHVQREHSTPARDGYPLVRALDALNGGPSALDEIDALRAREVAWQLRAVAAEAEAARLRPLHDYVNACRVEAPDVLHYVDAERYDHRTDKAYNLLAVLQALSP